MHISKVKTGYICFKTRYWNSDIIIIGGNAIFYISIYFKDILLQIITFNLSLFVNQNQNCQTGNRRDVQ